MQKYTWSQLMQLNNQPKNQKYLETIKFFKKQNLLEIITRLKKEIPYSAIEPNKNRNKTKKEKD